MTRLFGNAWQIIPGGAALVALALLATAGGVVLNCAPRTVSPYERPPAAAAIGGGAGWTQPAKSPARQDAETDRLLTAIEREVSQWRASPKRH